jgi:hypothetical protein
VLGGVCVGGRSGGRWGVGTVLASTHESPPCERVVKDPRNPLPSSRVGMCWAIEWRWGAVISRVFWDPTLAAASTTATEATRGRWGCAGGGGVIMAGRNGTRWRLHEAAEVDDVTTIRRLVAEGTDVNVQDAGGTRPLHVAVSNGHVEALKTLVELGADKEAPSAGGRPLHTAAQHGQTEAVKVLIEMGVDKEASAKDGVKPLYCAAYSGHVEVVKVMVELGADINAVDNYRVTPLYGASC